MSCDSSPEKANNCNRTPFKSDEECDRGSVDIHQFDDLPFCDSFAPSLPDIPPEVVDTPITLPIPPACTCVNINYNVDLKYNKERKFEGSASFSAVDDCCEGKYNTNLHLAIPCPIVGTSKPRTISIKMGYGSSGASAVESYITADSESCNIDAKDVDFDLKIPCPAKEGDEKPKIKASINWGDDGNSASASFLEVDRENCSIEGVDAVLDLKLPCPIRQDKVSKVSASIKYGDGDGSDSASFLEEDFTHCRMKGFDASLHLEIPCPVKKMIGADAPYAAIKAKIEYGNSFNSVQKFYMKADSVDCTIEGYDASFDLKIPCPNTKDMLDFQGSVAYAEDSNGAVSFSDVTLPTPGNECKRVVKCKVTFPKRAGGVGSSYEPDLVSINRNDVRKIQIYNWKTHTDPSTKLSDILGNSNHSDNSNQMIVRNSQGALEYVKIGFLNIPELHCQWVDPDTGE